MKEKILNRIEELKNQHAGFTKGSMRWKNFLINDIHISQVDFNTLEDDYLLFVFERIINQHYKGF